MLHLVTHANRARYSAQIEEMHRQRWRIYCEDRKWRALRELQRTPGVERDEYDDDRAVYLLAIEPCGAVVGSMRLRPTGDKSLLADKFMHLVNTECFRPDDDTWELTRMIRLPASRNDGEMRLRFNAAMAEFALSRGIRRYVTCIDTFYLRTTRALYGHKHRPLGLPEPYEEGEMIAIEYTIDWDTLHMIREAAALKHPVLYEAPCSGCGFDIEPALQEQLIDRLQSLTSAEARQLVGAASAAGAA